MDPETIAVPVSTLRQLLAITKAALPPRILWSEAKQRMDEAAHTACRDALQEIQTELETLLPDIKP